MDDCVSVGVGTGASVKDYGWVVLLSLVGAVGDIGTELAGNILLVDPEWADSWALHQWVFSDDCWSVLVGPVDFVNAVLVGQSK